MLALTARARFLFVGGGGGSGSIIDNNGRSLGARETHFSSANVSGVHEVMLNLNHFPGQRLLNVI